MIQRKRLTQGKGSTADPTGENSVGKTLDEIKNFQYIGSVGKDRTNFEMEHGGHGYGQQNPEGESILSFAQAYNLVVANTYFQKKDEHLTTYKSGDRCSTVDYIITR